MADLASEFLTTKELADLLRIKERKVYELAASGDVPCSRATGKLLFPRQAIDAWVARHSSGVMPDTSSQCSKVFLGSHDPLLEWALRASGTELATYFDGSLDGLERFSRGEGVATGLHLYDPHSDEWNLAAVRARFGHAPVALLEFAFPRVRPACRLRFQWLRANLDGPQRPPYLAILLRPHLDVVGVMRTPRQKPRCQDQNHAVPYAHRRSPFVPEVATHLIRRSIVPCPRVAQKDWRSVGLDDAEGFEDAVFADSTGGPEAGQGAGEGA